MARGVVTPAARSLRNSSVGRNSLPRIWSKCSLAAAITGKSAATMRRSSSARSSRALAMGRGMSARATGVVCCVILLGLRQRLHALRHVVEMDVDGEHTAIQITRLDLLARFFQRAAQPIQDAHALLIARRRQLEPSP